MCHSSHLEHALIYTYIIYIKDIDDGHASITHEIVDVLHLPHYLVYTIPQHPHSSSNLSSPPTHILSLLLTLSSKSLSCSFILMTSCSLFSIFHSTFSDVPSLHVSTFLAFSFFLPFLRPSASPLCSSYSIFTSPSIFCFSYIILC